VSRYLGNPIYMGRIRLKGETFDGLHEPIIEPSTWHKAAALRNSGARTKGKNRGRRPVGRHLFVKGTLRCGICGEAMVPRTDRNRRAAPSETYRCYGRHKHGTDYCPMPPLQRSDIDSAVYEYFSEVGLDLEATRAEIGQRVEHQLAEIRALRQEAERQEHHATESQRRIERDYTDGALTASEWRSLNARLESERLAATAEVARLEKQEHRIAENVERVDTETELLRHLAELRAAIAGEVQEAEGVAAIRSALQRMVHRFEVHRAADVGADAIPPPGDAPIGSPDTDAISAGGFVLYMDPNPAALEETDCEFAPVFRREPLYEAPNNYVDGLAT
jgi:hypothetical protein